jgi:hypothetical protein
MQSRSIMKKAEVTNAVIDGGVNQELASMQLGI